MATKADRFRNGSGVGVEVEDVHRCVATVDVVHVPSVRRPVDSVGDRYAAEDAGDGQGAAGRSPGGTACPRPAPLPSGRPWCRPRNGPPGRSGRRSCGCRAVLFHLDDVPDAVRARVHQAEPVAQGEDQAAVRAQPDGAHRLADVDERSRIRPPARSGGPARNGCPPSAGGCCAGPRRGPPRGRRGNRRPVPGSRGRVPRPRLDGFQQLRQPQQQAIGPAPADELQAHRQPVPGVAALGSRWRGPTPRWPASRRLPIAGGGGILPVDDAGIRAGRREGRAGYGWRQQQVVVGEEAGQLGLDLRSQGQSLRRTHAASDSRAAQATAGVRRPCPRHGPARSPDARGGCASAGR